MDIFPFLSREPKSVLGTAGTTQIFCEYSEDKFMTWIHSCYNMGALFIDKDYQSVCLSLEAVRLGEKGNISHDKHN